MVGFFVLCMMMGISFGITPNVSYAQSGDTPPANTTIGNQASATYTDSGGNVRTVTSNTVETVVQQVSAVSITQGVTKEVSPGAQVSFAHTITNDGNGTDTFNLTTVEGGGTFSFDNITLYADNNGDGVPDDLNSPITSTLDLAPGEQFGFVVLAGVPPSAVEGDAQTINVTGTSVFDNGVSASTTPPDEAIVSEGAVIDVVKAMSPTQGSVGQTVSINLTFTNKGNAGGTNLVLEDQLPAGLTYVPGSGQWSGSGTALTDAADGDEGGIVYAFNSGTVTATVAGLAAGQQGTLTFDVTVDNGTGGQTLNNTASYNHDDQASQQNTNTVSFQVAEDYGVVAETPNPVIVPSAGQGATVDFVNTFTNTGTVSDRYNMTVDTGNNTYPAGTTFTLYGSDGAGNAVNPLTDSNSDGIPDVGPIAAGSTFEVILRVSLPADASGDNSGTGFTVDKTAESIGDPNQFATITDQLDEITANTVDLTNNVPADGSGGAPGEGPGAETTPVTINDNVDPGTTTSFTLVVNNTTAAGGPSDNYDLSASGSAGFTTALPGGWAVRFLDSGGNEITNTGSIPAGDNLTVTAEVTVPGDVVAGAQDVYFRVRSASTGAEDIKYDQVDVNAVRNITLVSNNSGQIAPGGSVTYTHILTNEGNVDENDGVNSAIELVLANSEANGFTALVYVDNNGDGQIDANDDQVTSAGNSGLLASVGTLAPGAQVDLIVRVAAGSGVADGTTNTTTLTAQDSGTDPGIDGVFLNAAQLEDITTVVVGNVVIQKLQSPDGTAGSYISSSQNADPGDTIYYRILVTNQGSAAVSGIDISDSTPSYTTMAVQVAATGDGTPSVDAEPAIGSAGTIQVSSASLGAGESFTIEFAVQIDN